MPLGDGWLGINLGAGSGVAGTSAWDGTSMVVSGGGGDFWGTQDDGHFAYQPISGDFDFAVRVTEFAGDTSATYSKAIVAFKAAADDDGGEPSASAAGVYQSLNHHSQDYWYVRAGGDISEVSEVVLNGDGDGAYLRLTRTGDVFRSYHFEDGAGWVQHGERTVAIAAAGYIGVGATSTNDKLLTATFADFALNVATDPGTDPGTDPAPDTTPPIIEDLAVAAAGTSAVVTWTTDEPTTGLVEFGLTTGYGESVAASTATTSHRVVLEALSPDTGYHLRVKSTDAAGNEATGADVEFDSGQAPLVALPEGWSSIDLGNGRGGSATHHNGVFSISGNGGDFWDSQDDGHFAYMAVSGDFVLIAQLDRYEGDTSSAYAKGVLAFKADTGAGQPTAASPGVYQSLNYASDDYWYERTSWISDYNAAPLNATGGSALLKMTRTDNIFRSYHWEDGIGWVQHGGDRNIALAADGYVGIGATSGHDGLLTVHFSNVSVEADDAPGGGDKTPPVIENATAAASATTATIAWTTDEAATGVLEYGLTPAYGDQQSADTASTSQSVTVAGLTPSTTYYYRIVATNEAGLQTTGIERNFTTGAPPSEGPTISNIRVADIGRHQATVSWTTDVPTTTEIDFDLETWPKDVRDLALTTEHVAVIGEMMAGETHSFVVTAEDAFGQTAVSELLTVETLAYASGALPDGWSGIDIGPVSTELPGSAVYDPSVNGGSFVVRGTGTDVYFSRDSFHFVHHPVEGDFVLTLRVDGYHGYLHIWTKAMTMFRANLDRGSPMFNQSINYAGNDYLYYRLEQDAGHVDIVDSQLHSSRGAPLYARLTRVGDTFWEEYSHDGESWQYHGPAEGTTVALPSAGFVGFGVCSKSNSFLSEIVYSQVTLDAAPVASTLVAPRDAVSPR